MKKAIYYLVIAIELLGILGIVLFGLALFTPAEQAINFPKSSVLWFSFANSKPLIFGTIAIVCIIVVSFFEFLRKLLSKKWWKFLD